MKKVILNLDDFSVVNSRLDLLLKLKEHFPKFKVSLFTIPNDKMDYGPYLIRYTFLTEIKNNLDWMELIPHGYKHESKEEIRSLNYKQFMDLTKEVDKAFKEDGLPYVNGFKAPHYAWNAEVRKALDDLGWFGAIKRGHKNKTKRFYEFTHSLDEPFWESDLDVLKLNGHLYGCKDDLGLNFDNLLKLPKDIEWDFVSNHING